MKNNIAIRRGSRVKLVNTVSTLYGTSTIAANEDGIVLRVKRTGIKPILVQAKGKYGNDSAWVKREDVSPVAATNNQQVNVGDLFCASWGYEACINTFFQVVKVKASSVVVRRIDSKQNHTGRGVLEGTETPTKDNFRGEEQTFRLTFNLDGSPSFKYQSYTRAFPADWNKEYTFYNYH